MNNIYELTLTAPDGQERHTLAWFPTEKVQCDFYARAQHNGLKVRITNNK